MQDAPSTLLLLMYVSRGTMEIYNRISIPYSFFFLKICLIIHVSIQSVCLFSLYYKWATHGKIKNPHWQKSYLSDWWSSNKWVIINFLISCFDWSPQTHHTYRHRYKHSFYFEKNSEFMWRKWHKMKDHYVPFYKYFPVEKKP